MLSLWSSYLCLIKINYFVKDSQVDALWVFNAQPNELATKDTTTALSTRILTTCSTSIHPHFRNWHHVAPKTLAQFLTQPTPVTAKHESVERMETDGANSKRRVLGAFPTLLPVIRMSSMWYEDLPCPNRSRSILPSGILSPRKANVTYFKNCPSNCDARPLCGKHCPDPSWWLIDT